MTAVGSKKFAAEASKRLPAGAAGRRRSLTTRATSSLARRVEYLAFRLHTENYGLEIARVREILKIPPITEVPRAPGHILGIVSVRGTVVTVVDLRRRLRLPEQPIQGSSRILLVEWQRERVGLLVDEVLQVIRLAPEEIEQAPTIASGSESDAVCGVGRPDDRIVVLLNLDVLLGRPGARAASAVPLPPGRSSIEEGH